MKSVANPIQNNYPTVFIHGFLGWGSEDQIETVLPYWGAQKDRDMLAFLREQGYEVYNPSVGPYNSAWDRACELWARLVGGTVDYGKVHSEKYGHKRFGRTYPGILTDWGKEGNHRKINLVGHSFGGPTVRMFAWLLAAGSKEEQEGTPAEELSCLFTGGKEEWIHTVTTLSGVNNGTTYDSLHGTTGIRVMADLMLSHIARFGDTDANKLKDFHMEQWDLMDVPAKTRRNRIRLPLLKARQINHFSTGELDNIGYEMSLKGMHEINEAISPSPNMYYFARRACRTHENKKGNQVPDKNMSSFCDIPAYLSGRARNEEWESYGFSEEWLPNDGFVNVVGLSAPLNEPYVEWDPTMSILPGLWYNMPVEDKDHMSWMGFGEKTDVLYRYYLQMLDLFRKLPDGETVAVSKKTA